MARITLADLQSLQMPPDVLGNPGLQDIEALKAASWGSDYDVDARRRKIAEALTAQQMEQQTAQIAPRGLPGEAPQQFRLSGEEPDRGIGAGDAPAATGRDPGNVTQQDFFSNVTPEKSFTHGQPPGPTMFNAPDRGRVTVGEPVETDEHGNPLSAPDGRSNQDIIDAIMGNVMAANAFAQAAPAPSGRGGATPGNAPTSSGATVHAGSIVDPGAFGQPGSGEKGYDASKGGYSTAPGGAIVATSVNPFSSPFGSPTAPPGPVDVFESGLPNFGAPPAGALPAPNTMFDPTPQTAFTQPTPTPADVPLGNPPSGPVVDYTGPTPGSPLGTPSGRGATDYSGPLGREGTAGGPGAPGQGKSGGGKGDQASQTAADIAEAMSQGFTMASTVTPAPSGWDFTSPATGPFDPGGSYSMPGSFAAGNQAAISQGAQPGGGFSLGGRGSGVIGMLADMTAQGMPSPGGGTFGSGFSTNQGFTGAHSDFGGALAPDTNAGPSLSDTGDVSGGMGGQGGGGGGGGGIGGAGDPGGPGGLGGGGGIGGGGLGAGAGGFGGGGAAGGSGGFGGMGPGGGVGGMSTGGTGETGSVAGETGPGGFGGNSASAAGGFGGFDPGSGGFDPGGGNEGTSGSAEGGAF